MHPRRVLVLVLLRHVRGHEPLVPHCPHAFHARARERTVQHLESTQLGVHLGDRVQRRVWGQRAGPQALAHRSRGLGTHRRGHARTAHNFDMTDVRARAGVRRPVDAGLVHGIRFRSIEAEVRPFLDAHSEYKFFCGLERGGGRSFYVYRSAEEFLNSVEWHDNFCGAWHEYLHPNRPVRLAFDLDDKQKLEGWTELKDRIRNESVNALGEKARVCIDLVGDTEAKFSSHLVFPNAWMAGATSLARFVRTSRSRLAGDTRVDTQVFSDNPAVFKSIRMPYCRAPGKGVLIPAGAPAEFDRDAFLGALLTHGDPDPADLVEIADAGGPGRAAVTGSVQEQDQDPVRLAGVARIEQFIKKYWAVDRLQIKRGLEKGSGIWIWHATPSVWCAVRCGRHESNNSMIRGQFLDSENRVRLCVMCQDDDCGRTWIEDRTVDWTAVARPPESYAAQPES